MKKYTFNYEPEFYKYIMSSNILNKRKCEDKILKDLVAGYTCEEISNKRHYCVRTIASRRKDIYKKTRRYMVLED